MIRKRTKLHCLWPGCRIVQAAYRTTTEKYILNLPRATFILDPINTDDLEYTKYKLQFIAPLNSFDHIIQIMIMKKRPGMYIHIQHQITF